MSISSKRLQELVEERIGQGKSKEVFGKYYEQLYEVMADEESDLTEELFEEGLKRCKFKDPERVGLISLVCPILCMDIPDRVFGKYIKELYRFCLYVWYFMLVVNIIQSLVKWELTNSVPLMLLCLVITSWSFRNWSRDWNKLELIFHVLNVNRVMKRRE